MSYQKAGSGKISIGKETFFGLGEYDVSRLSRPASITGKLDAVDIVSQEGADGMIMPVGHKGYNGTVTGPFYDLSTLAPWLVSNPTMPHSREPAASGLRKLHPIRWTDVVSGGPQPHPNYDLQNTVNFLRVLQNRYPIPIVEAAMMPLNRTEERVTVLHPPELSSPYHVRYLFRVTMSGETRRNPRPDWIIDYWTYHRWWYGDTVSPSGSEATPPQLEIPPVDPRNHFRNRARFRFAMAMILDKSRLSPIQQQFHSLVCDYWEAHPLDLKNDDNNTAREYIHNIKPYLATFYTPDFREWHLGIAAEYRRMGSFIPSPFGD